MKRLALAVILLTSCSALKELPKQVCRKADVYVYHGVDSVAHRNVEILDEEEDFCIFIEQGVARMERAPYKIICNQ